VPVESNKSIAVTLVGLITVLWGGAHLALSVFCYLPGNNWSDSMWGFAPVHWIAVSSYEDSVVIIFGLQGILAILAGSGVLLRLQWGRILTFILVILAFLWALDSVDAYTHQGDSYEWKRALIPFAAVQVLYGVLTIVILIKNGAAFSELADSDPSRRVRPIYVWAAWASPSSGATIALALWVMTERPPFAPGEGPVADSIIWLGLLLASVAGVLAGVISLFGIRSRRHALSIIPGALLGICSNGFLAFVCLLAYTFAGKNMSTF
jgi:hypothetical protein